MTVPGIWAEVQVGDIALVSTYLSEYVVAAEVAANLDLASDQPFQGWHVLAVQHVHSSLTPLIDALCLGGARPADITVLGKSYSSRDEGAAELAERNVRFVDPRAMDDPGRSFECELGERAEAALTELDQAAERLLVLDEGAVAALALSRHPELASRARVVEQTTRGARSIEAVGAPCPAIDVARSAAKSSLEGLLVGGAMVAGIRLILTELQARPSRVGLVGYGRMGATLAMLLAREFDVAVHDTDTGHEHQAGLDGYPVVSLPTLLRSVDMVVGCTGGPIVDHASLDEITKTLILINGASSDIEYPIWDRRTPDRVIASSVSPRSADDDFRPWLNHYRTGHKGEHILASGGFPANFHHHLVPIPNEKFQVTRSLMLAGATQVIREPARPGLWPLDPGLQRMVVDAWTASGLSGEQGGTRG